MTLTIKAEALLGDSIAETAADMLALANRTKCWVEVRFNGVDLRMRPDGSPDRLVEDYDRVVRLEGLQPRMAFG